MKNCTLIFLSNRVIIIDRQGNVKVRECTSIDVNLKDNSFDFTSTSDAIRYIGKPNQNRIILNLVDTRSLTPILPEIDEDIQTLIDSLLESTKTIEKYIIK